MLSVLVILLYYLNVGSCRLWDKGVVHYAINHKDYDLHSQDEIISALSQLQNEICVKFFNTPLDYNNSDQHKILYISNPEKRKICPPDHYDYTKTIVDMPIGYKCLNQKEIARIVVDVLRASIEQNVPMVNSMDLFKKFREHELETSRPTLLSPSDRHYINAHYHAECGALSKRPAIYRRIGDDGPTDNQISEENRRFYEDKLWPLGVVMYGVQPSLRSTPDYYLLRHAMTHIELSTCLVFQELKDDDDVIIPKNFIWFSSQGQDMPLFGFAVGNQTINLNSMVHGAPAHSAHAAVNLLRVVGAPMMSNRYDRDNHLIVHWKNIQRGKEVYLERLPKEAWLQMITYDFDSITHAPANYMCGACELNAYTVQPVQDHLWQRTLSMGHKKELSPSDVRTIQLLYGEQCKNRYMS